VVILVLRVVAYSKAGTKLLVVPTILISKHLEAEEEEFSIRSLSLMNSHLPQSLPQEVVVYLATKELLVLAVVDCLETKEPLEVAVAVVAFSIKEVSLQPAVVEASLEERGLVPQLSQKEKKLMMPNTLKPSHLSQKKSYLNYLKLRVNHKLSKRSMTMMMILQKLALMSSSILSIKLPSQLSQMPSRKTLTLRTFP